VRTACAAVLIGAFVAAVFGIGTHSAFLSSYDFREFIADDKAYLAAALRAGRLPLWTPHILGGWPFLANPEAQVFYPVNLLYLWLPLRHAALLDLSGHLLLGWLGTAYWARSQLRLSEGPAFFAGLVFAVSGFMVSHGLAGHLTLLQAAAYVPWIAAVGLRLTESAEPSGASRRMAIQATAICALLLGLQLLSGGVQVAWLGLLAVGICCASSLLLRRPTPGWRVWARTALSLAGVVTLGVALAAAQLLPAMELAELGNRPQHDYGYARTDSLDPAQLVMAIAPRLRLDPLAETPWREFYSYAGLLPLALALLALVAGIRERSVAVLTPVLAFMALYMLGDHAFLHRLLFDYVPSFDLFRVPARALLIVHLVLALLAGHGLQILLRLWPRLSPPLALAAAACVVTLADVGSTARWHRSALLGPGSHPEVVNRAQRTAAYNAAILRADEGWYRYWADPGLLPQNYAFSIDRRSVNGYTGLLLARFQRFVGVMAGFGSENLGVAALNPQILARAQPFSLPLLGVKYEFAGGGVRERPGGPDVPRAWFASRALQMPGEVQALQYMKSAVFRPLEEVLLEPDAATDMRRRPVAASSAHPVNVTVQELAPERLRIALGPHPAGFLVLSEIFYPGWQAAVAGKTLQVIRCDVILRCVPLAGSNTGATIDMWFAPVSLRTGVLLSALALLAVGALAAASRLIAAPRRACAESPTAPRP
jgi:hypothetical protein